VLRCGISARLRTGLGQQHALARRSSNGRFTSMSRHLPGRLVGRPVASRCNNDAALVALSGLANALAQYLWTHALRLAPGRSAVSAFYLLPAGVGAAARLSGLARRARLRAVPALVRDAAARPPACARGHPAKARQSRPPMQASLRRLRELAAGQRATAWPVCAAGAESPSRT